MIDIRKFRDNPQLYIEATKNKGFDINFDEFMKLDTTLLSLKRETDDLNAERNKLSESVKETQKVGGDITPIVARVKELKITIEEKQKEYDAVESEWKNILGRIPNPALRDVIIGKDDSENVEAAVVGQKKDFSFTPKPHWEILEAKGYLDSERAVKISGSRFVFLKGGLAMLELAIVQFCMNKLAHKGFTPVIAPTIVREPAMLSTGYLPYGADSIYRVTSDENGQEYLVGTSEVPLVAQHSEETLNVDQLPLRYVGFSSCYRGEAGTYGKDTKGLIRVHQFEKVEMVSFCKPEDSEKEHELIREIEEEIYQELGIPFRRLHICTGDLGVPAAKKYDLEAWFPGMNTYKEITSCSNCTDYQTRRANIKYKEGDKREFAHSLNGTASAIGRTMAAIVENYQTEDGNIEIPEALIPYMGGTKII